MKKCQGDTSQVPQLTRGGRKLRGERAQCFVVERKYSQGRLLQRQLLHLHWLPLAFFTATIPTLRRTNVNNGRRGFSLNSYLRRLTLFSRGLPMSSRTSSCWSESVWLSPMQQLQLCNRLSPLTSEFCCHNIFFPRLQQKQKMSRNQIQLMQPISALHKHPPLETLHNP